MFNTFIASASGIISQFEPNNFIVNLKYMVSGMVAIFIVIGIIAIVTAIFNKLFNKNR